MRAQGSGERFDRETWAAELTPLLNLWKRLNQVSEDTSSSLQTSSSE